jgi:hypothetical protein
MKQAIRAAIESGDRMASGKKDTIDANGAPHRESRSAAAKWQGQKTADRQDPAVRVNRPN